MDMKMLPLYLVQFLLFHCRADIVDWTPCSFEKHLCGWIQPSASDISWVKTNINLSSGRPFNSAGQGDSYLLAIMNGTQKGDKAIIESQPFDYDGTFCLLFEFIARKASENLDLKVLIKPSEESDQLLIQKDTFDDFVMQWKCIGARIQTANNRPKIIIEIHQNGSDSNEFGLDNIRLSSDKCLKSCYGLNDITNNQIPTTEHYSTDTATTTDVNSLLPVYIAVPVSTMIVLVIIVACCCRSRRQNDKNKSSRECPVVIHDKTGVSTVTDRPPLPPRPMTEEDEYGYVEVSSTKDYGYVEAISTKDYGYVEVISTKADYTHTEERQSQNFEEAMRGSNVWDMEPASVLKHSPY